MIANLVGRKKAEKAKLSQSYTLYDRCSICPLWVYIDLVCYDKVESLVIEGKATGDVLRALKSKIIIEFSELSGNKHTTTTTNSLRNIYLYQSQILGLKLALTLLLSGDIKDPTAYLKASGIKTDEKSFESLIGRIKGYIKGKEIKMAEELKRYASMTEGKENTITEQYFAEQLVSLSKHVGFALNRNITLSDYAAYLKDYQTYIDTINHGKFK